MTIHMGTNMAKAGETGPIAASRRRDDMACSMAGSRPAPDGSMDMDMPPPVAL
jgi:hypothetical protein